MVQFTRDFLVAAHARDSSLGRRARDIAAAWRPHAAARCFDLEVLYELLCCINRPYAPTDTSVRTIAQSFSKDRQSELLEYYLKHYIQSRCANISPQRVRYMRPLIDIAASTGTLDIATLNYDLCVEVLAARYRTRCVTGFDERTGKWDAGLLRRTGSRRSPRLRLLKLHGSANWFEHRPGQYFAVSPWASHQQAILPKSARSRTLERVLLYPGFSKQPVWPPFFDLIRRFSAALRAAELCVVAGFSFRDTYLTDLFSEALYRNDRLRLLIVAPKADTIVRRLTAGSHRGLRVGRVEPVDAAHGRFEQALARGWLLKRIQRYTSIRSPSLRGRPRACHRQLQRPISGLAYDGATNRLYCTTASTPAELLQLDFHTNIVRTAATGLARARGVAIVGTDEVVVVENEYRGSQKDPRWLMGIEGVGRVWQINARTSLKRPITSFNAAGQSLRHLEQVFNTDPQRFWEQNYQLLNWPTAVALHPRGTLAYVTEAQGIATIDLKTRVVRTRRLVKLGFNVVDVRVCTGGSLLLLDGGVADQEIGTGRVIILNPSRRKMNQVLTLPPFPASALFSQKKHSIYVSTGGAFPAGAVIEFRVSDGLEIRRWSGLHRPGALALAVDKAALFVASGDGLIKLSVRR